MYIYGKEMSMKKNLLSQLNKIIYNIRKKQISCPFFYLLFIFYALNSFFLARCCYVFFRYNLKFELEILPSMIPWVNTKMWPILVMYLSGVFFLGLSLIISLIGVGKNSKQAQFIRSPQFLLLLSVEVIFGVLLTSLRTSALVLFVLVVLTIFVFNPYLYIFIFNYIEDIIFNKNNNKLYWFIIVCCGFFILFIYKDIILKPEVILNAYYRIPESYILKQNINNQSEERIIQYINTTDIINSTLIPEVFKKIDVFNASEWKKHPACIFVGPNNRKVEELSRFYSIEKSFKLGEHTTGASISKTYLPVLAYEDDTLCIFEAVGNNNNEVTKENVKLWKALKTAGITKPSSFTTIHTQTIEQRDMLLANATEKFLHDAAFNNYYSILARGNLKHQQHVYLPAHEFLLGKPLTEISHQYGLGLTLVVAGLSKCLSPDGYVDYGVYQRYIPWVACLAFLIFSGAMIGIFKSVKIAVIPIMLWSASRLMPGFESFFDSSGWLFFRVLLLPVVLLFIVEYFRSSSHKNKYLFIICLTIQLSMFLSFQFGFMSALSTLGIFVIAYLIEKNIHYIFNFFIMLVNILLGFFLYNIGKSNGSQYVFMGLVSLPIPSIEIFAYLMLFFIFVCMFFHMNFYQSKIKYSFLYTVFFRYIIFTYYLWSGMKNHYFTYFTEIMMPYIFYGYFLLYERNVFPRIKQAFVFIFTLILCVTLAPFAKSYFSEVKQYKRNIKNMQIFEWNLPGSHIKSTMNPDFFADSIELIHKYIPDEEKSIFIISRYDAFISLLSRKYSGLPHFDISPYLVTPKEVELTLNSLTENSPMYIFVDNDVIVPAELDLAPVSLYGNYLHAESRIQLMQAKELTKLYKEIIPDNYIPIDHSQLLTVYKKVVH